MTTLLIGLLIFFAAGSLVGVGLWAESKRPLIKNCVALCLSAGAAYSVGFLLYMWTLAANGSIRPASNVVLPSLTWLVIGGACIAASFHANASRYARAAPFLLEGAIGLAFAPLARESSISPMQQAIFIGAPLLLIGVVLLTAAPPPRTAP